MNMLAPESSPVATMLAESGSVRNVSTQRENQPFTGRVLLFVLVKFSLECQTRLNRALGG